MEPCTHESLQIKALSSQPARAWRAAFPTSKRRRGESAQRVATLARLLALSVGVVLVADASPANADARDEIEVQVVGTAPTRVRIRVRGSAPCSELVADQIMNPGTTTTLRSSADCICIENSRKSASSGDWKASRTVCHPSHALYATSTTTVTDMAAPIHVVVSSEEIIVAPAIAVPPPTAPLSTELEWAPLVVDVAGDRPVRLLLARDDHGSCFDAQHRVFYDEVIGPRSNKSFAMTSDCVCVDAWEAPLSPLRWNPAQRVCHPTARRRGTTPLVLKKQSPLVEAPTED